MIKLKKNMRGNISPRSSFSTSTLFAQASSKTRQVAETEKKIVSDHFTFAKKNKSDISNQQKEIVISFFKTASV